MSWRLKIMKRSKRKASGDGGKGETPRRRHKSEIGSDPVVVDSSSGDVIVVDNGCSDIIVVDSGSSDMTVLDSCSSDVVEVISIKAGTGEDNDCKRSLVGCGVAATIKIRKPKKTYVKDDTLEGEKYKFTTDNDAQTNRKKSSRLQSSVASLERGCTSKAEFDAKYFKLDMIGEGAFGSVYAGFRQTDYLPVAIKHIKRPTKPSDFCNGVPLEVALMQRVAGGAESVGKSAAISLLDWYHLDRQLILVMERPIIYSVLSQYLSNMGTISEPEAKLFMRQLVDAAIDMHRKGVFHRDIKCENLLLDFGSTFPRLRIIDFGCGSFLKKRSHRVFCGTLVFAPPEWLLERQYEAGPTTVWQLGALLYQMLHGCLFTTEKFLSGKRHFSKKLSKDCLDFLKQCLTRFPKQRATLPKLKHHPWLILSLTQETG